MTLKSELVYGTCVALGEHAAILKGPSGSGKSDLALRFIFAAWPGVKPRLVSDDQIRVTLREGTLIAAPPETIAGKIEVRGLGIVEVPYQREAQISLIVRLADKRDVPRMPPSPPEMDTICGINVPVMTLSPFEASAELKLRLAIETFVW